MNILIMIVTALLSIFFLFAGSVKLLGWQKMIFEKQLKFFQSYGLNRQVMALVGMVELFGAMTIWFQSTLLGLLGAMALFMTSLGAIYCHLRFDTWKDGIPASITLTLAAIIIYLG